MNLEYLSNISLLGNSIETWIMAVVSVPVVWGLLAFINRVVLGRLEQLAKSTDTFADDLLVYALGKTRTWLMFLVGLYIGSLFLDLTASVSRVVQLVMLLGLILQGGLWANSIINCLLERSRENKLKEDPASVTTLSVIGFVSKLVLWSFVILLVLDNLGFDITALIAGLGVGGVAVALAVQKILGDLFASLSIVFDKPFSVGDFIVVDSLMGSVEYVGLKTTRVRSLSGEQLVFSNSDLLSSRIHNFGRMYKRRVVFRIGVTYQTSREKLEMIPGIMREAIEAHENTTFDRAHFFSYGSYSLDFEIVYYVLSPDYNIYMDIQQAINLDIHRRFEQENIEFAYPTQTLFVERGVTTTEI